MSTLKEQQLIKNKKFIGYFTLGVFLLSLGLLFLLVTQTNIYCDDYRYATFFKDGLGQFWENTKNHYLISNGRVLIHIIIPLVLLFKSSLYMVLFPLIICGIFYLGSKFQNREKNLSLYAAIMAIAAILFLGMDLGYFRATVYWISGSFNYIFPVLLILFALSLQWKSLERSKISPLALVFSFLGGATTEQCGAMAIMGFFFLGLLFFIKEKKGFLLCFLPVILSCIGYLTVVLAPGTGARVDADSGDGLLSVFEEGVLAQRFSGVFQYFTGVLGYSILGVLVAVAYGILPLCDKKESKFLLIGLPVAIALLASIALEEYGFGVMLFLCYLGVMGIFFLFSKKTWGSAILIIMALVSLLIMLSTTIFSYRIAVPGILLVILVGASGWGKVIMTIKPVYAILFILALLTVSLFSFVPILMGTAATNRVYEENMSQLEEAKTTKEAHFTVDFNDQYGFALINGDGYFHYDFRKAYDVAEDTVIYLESKDLPSVYYENEQVIVPAITVNDQLYFPLNPLLSHYGVMVEWHEDASVTIPYGSKTYVLKDNKAMVYNEAGEVIETFEALTYNEFVLSSLYLEAGAYEKLFSLEYEFNKQNNCYIFKKK